MRTDIESIEFNYTDYGLEADELMQIEKCICQIAKEIFPELKDLKNDIFILNKQRIWTNRNHENLNTEFLDYYQRLINLQKNVKSSRQEASNLLDIPLEELPSTSNPAKNHALEEKNTKGISVQSFASSMSEIESLIAGSKGNNNISDDVENEVAKTILLMNVNKEVAIKNLLLLRSQPNTQDFFALLAKSIQTDVSCLSLLFDVLDTRGIELSLNTCLLKVRCLEACNWSNLLRNRTQYLREIRSCCNQLFNSKYWKCIKESMLKTFALSPKTARSAFFPVLNRAMLQSDKQIRRDAIQAISLLSHADPFQSIECIKQALNDKEPEVREAGVYALSKIERKSFVSLFQKFGLALEADSSSNVRKTLAWTLGQDEIRDLGSSFTSLINLIFDSVEEVSYEAMLSLSKIKDISTETVRNIEELFKNTKEANKEKIITVFGEWGRGISTLVDNLQDPLFRIQALHALQKIGQKLPKSVIPLLIPMLASNDAFVDQEILPLLILLCKENQDVMKKQIDFLISSGNVNMIAHHVIRILSHLGKDQAGETFALIQKIAAETNDKPPTQSAKAYAIGHLYRNNLNQGLNLLSEFLNSENMNVKICAIQALGHFASYYESNANVPSDFKLLCDKIQSILNHTSADVRKAGIEALGNLGKGSLELISNFYHQEESIRNRLLALKILVKIGEESVAELLLKRVQPILKDGNAMTFIDIKQEIFELIGQIIQKEISPNEISTVEKFFFDCLHHKNHAINAIRILPKLNIPKDRVIDLLAMCIQSDLKQVIHSIATLEGPLPLKNPLIDTLIDIFIKKLPGYEDAAKILSQIDLSAFPEVMLTMIKTEHPNVLKWTPLENLLNKYSSEKGKEENYLFAITHKSLTEGVGLFVEDGFLCMSENNRLKKIIKKNQIQLPENPLFQYQIKSLEWRAQALEAEYYPLAGYYYKKAGNLDNMMACFKRGISELEALKTHARDKELNSSECFKTYSKQLERCLEAICQLGICYQTGVGITPKTGDKAKAANYYLQAALSNHAQGTHLFNLCSALELGTKKIEDNHLLINSRNELFVKQPFPLHVFNLSYHPYLIDEKNCLPPAGTIALALLTLEPTAVDLHKVVECLDNIKKTKKRADYQFLCPHVSLDSKSGDLIS